MSTMRFKSADDQNLWYTACQMKCDMEVQKNEQKEDVFCDGKFVDCDGFGGYDPRDPCRQTCVTPIEGIKGA